MPQLTAETIIEQLGLVPLGREGGYYRQTWRSPVRIPDRLFDSSHPNPDAHAAGTAIYFLVTPDQFSALHRLKTDEIWLYHLGDPLEMLVLDRKGNGQSVRIGPDLSSGQRPQHICPAGSWQGTRIAPGKEQSGYSLASCIMTPGFEWRDFELGHRADLIETYPDFAASIKALTRTSEPGSRG